ncbi:hypothetical protein [Cryptosporangium phraense]|uniref:Uncharacterized protein n=1 Tax=Cryptosporangium phraense TaxID=2593070 RepID=A0A545AH82_9ACTN|nr:hypothetical protein [Cryptosporangium phraense]TQS40679.1 hypothetical protein FL583_33695 [Cryptosporangium phraense]
MLGENGVPSLRLRQILRTYCHQLDPLGVADLRASLAAGKYPWLHDELTAALTTSSPDGAWWLESVGAAAESSPAPARLGTAAAQRYLWHTLFPAESAPVR